MTSASLMGLATFLLGVPAVTVLLYALPRWHRFLLGIMAFGTCHVKKPFYMEVFFVNYRGVDRGFGVTVPDLLFFGFFIWLVTGGSKEKLIWWPYNTTLWLLFLAACMISLINSSVPYYGLFSLHKFIRGFVLYWVTVNLVRTREDVQAVITGVMAAVLFESGVVIWDKYITKRVVNRSVGTFPHPNTLAMYVDLIMPMLLSVLLTDGFSKRQTKWAAGAILGGILCVIFSKSRASLLIMGAALGMATCISILIKPTSRKVIIVLLGFVAMDVIGVMAAPKIIARFEKAPEASEMTRVYFNMAARAMAQDKLFGSGLNSYSWVIEHTDYYWYVYPDALEEEKDLEAFRESDKGISRLGTAHHIYFLFAAETGWPGMIVFICFLASFYLRNLVLFLRTRDEYYQAVALGLLVGFSTLHLQGLLEWIFRQTQVFLLFCLLSGLMVAIGNIARERYQNA
jgi:hypothetical protein